MSITSVVADAETEEPKVVLGVALHLLKILQRRWPDPNGAAIAEAAFSRLRQLTWEPAHDEDDDE